MVTSSPRKCILWSASIAFILSYPFIYTALSIGLPNVTILPHTKTTHIIPDLYVKQLYISPPPFSSALSGQFTDSLEPFLNSFPKRDGNPDSLLAPGYVPQLVSVFPNVLRTNSTHALSSLDRFVSDPSIPRLAQLQSVLYLPRVVASDILSAAGILISYLYHTPEDEQVWNSAISSLLTSTTSTALNPFSYVVPVKEAIEPRSWLQLSFTVLPFCPIPLLGFTVTYSLLTSYVALSWEHVSSVRSKMGLFVAFVVQVLLSIAASISIISFFFPTFSGDSLRNFLIVPYFIVIVSLEGLIRLLNAVARTPLEDPPSSRLKTGFSSSIGKTIGALSTYSGILLLYYFAFPFVSPQIRHICLFTVLALFLNLCLHVTYFSAVLFIDLQRLEIDDLISADVITTQTHSLLPFENQMPKLLKGQYLYLRHLYLHPTLSASATVLTLSLIFLSIWGYITDPSEQHNYSSNKITFFMSPLLSSPTLSKYGSIRVFEPIVLQGEFSKTGAHKIIFKVGSSIQSSFFSLTRILSVPIILEFLASLGFILSLTGVIFKFVCPPKREHTEMTPSSEVLEFFSKELTGCHTLDVLMVVSQGSTITTVSLDHKVFVWNASSAPGTKVEHPIEIFNPPDFWPINKVVLNSSLGLIAFFCTKLAAIKCFDYRTGVPLYHIHDDSLFSVLPVALFFSRGELIAITRTGVLVSISSTGVMTNVDVEFSNKAGHLTHARPLVTPRIPERVVCISSENDISIGTHIGKVWKFRKLQIQESPMQINMHAHAVSHGMHDLSKYKPQPIPAPQAMLSRRLMKTGKMGAMNGMNRMPIEKPKPKILSNPILAIVPVPAINMVLLATSIQACLFDAQTGIIVRNFQLGHFKPNTLRVFHSQPTHCRFCGCVSVDTLSIAYTEVDGMVICHTLTIDNRAKNSICIRVERDPRETRCLGFEATTERQHWLERVEGWDATDINMIMGVRRKEVSQSIENEGTDSKLSSLRSRKNKVGSAFSRYNPPANRFPLISSTWEGFAMSAIGEISYYDIPDYSEHVQSDKTSMSKDPHISKRYFGGYGGIGLELDAVLRRRLLIRSIGPVTKYGAKSIAVAFGNIIKVLYFGKEESLPNADPGPSTKIYVPSPSPSISGGKKWRREVGY